MHSKPSKRSLRYMKTKNFCEIAYHFQTAKFCSVTEQKLDFLEMSTIFTGPSKHAPPPLYYSGKSSLFLIKNSGG